MFPFVIASVVLIFAVCEFVAWLRYSGGGTRFVSEDEVRTWGEPTENADGWHEPTAKKTRKRSRRIMAPA